MSVKYIPLALVLFLRISSIQNMNQRGCNVKHAYYNLVCSRFEFWCTTKHNFLTYEAICKNITLNAKSVLALEDKEKIYDIEIYTSDVNSLTAGMFIDYPNIARLYLQTSNTNEIQANAFNGLNKLDWLILKTNNITIIQPKAFSGLKKLNVLNLNLNNLSELRDYTFGGLESLQFLSLKQNKITSIEDKTFANLSKLGVIFLNDNFLTIISDKLFANNNLLRFAWFPNNQIESFPTNFLKTKNLLGEIILHNNRIISLNYERFSGNISLYNNQLKNLSPIGKLSTDYIDLSFNNFSSIPAEIFDSSSNNLSILLLNDNYICDIHPDAFRYLTKLSTLRLDHNNISELPLGLFQDLKNLYLLNISRNQISHLESGAFTGLTYLDTLDLAHNKLYAIQIGALYPLKQLKAFNLRDNLLEYINVENLILHLVNLKVIDIDNNIWTCDWLSTNLVKLDARKIKVLHGETLKTSNVHGISCTNSKLNMTEVDYSSKSMNDDGIRSEILPDIASIKNSVEASYSVADKSSSRSDAPIFIFATLAVVCLVCAAFYVINKYWLRNRIVLQRIGNNETVSYKLDLVEEHTKC